MSDRPYTAKQVCRAAQIAPTTLRTWRSRGLDVGSKAAEQDWTRYSVADVVRVAVVADLGARGVDLPAAAKAVANLGVSLSVQAPLFLLVWLDPCEAVPDEPKSTSRRENLPSLASSGARTDLVSKWCVNMASDLPGDGVALVVDVAKVCARVRALLAA